MGSASSIMASKPVSRKVVPRRLSAAEKESVIRMKAAIERKHKAIASRGY